MPEGNRNASPLSALSTEAGSLINEVSRMHLMSDETSDDRLPSPTSPASVGSTLVDPAVGVFVFVDVLATDPLTGCGDDQIHRQRDREPGHELPSFCDHVVICPAIRISYGNAHPVYLTECRAVRHGIRHRVGSPPSCVHVPHSA